MLLAVNYLHPNRNISAFQSKLWDILIKLESKKIHNLICDGININTLQLDDNNTMEYINSLNSSNCIYLINLPTRIAEN